MAMQTNRDVTNISGDTQPLGNWARYLNALIAAWLFISAFAWGHTVPLRQDTWIVGILMFVTALIAMATPGFRWVNTVLAIWLFISTLAFPHRTPGTLWNNLIVAVVVFLLSLVPSNARVGGTTPAHRTT